MKENEQHLREKHKLNMYIPLNEIFNKLDYIVI